MSCDGWERGCKGCEVCGRWDHLQLPTTPSDLVRRNDVMARLDREYRARQQRVEERTPPW